MSLIDELIEVKRQALLDGREVERFILSEKDLRSLVREGAGLLRAPVQVDDVRNLPDIGGFVKLPNTRGPKVLLEGTPVYLLWWDRPAPARAKLGGGGVA
jgi:hypothetical protein